MSRTASCFFALSISVALAAACGDDDSGPAANGGGGGSGGAGASGGSAGTGGEAGSGDSGSGGDAGTGGTAAGTGGGGSGGSGNNGGTAGTTAGSSGSGGEEPDAGPDGSVVTDSGAPDSSAAGSAGTAGTGGIGPVDSGLNGNCPNFATAATAIAPQGGQEVVIARVIFNTDDTARVVLRATGAPFNLADPQKLCVGPEDSDCLDIGTLIDDETIPSEIAVGAEVSITVDATPDEGEIALITNFPQVSDAFTFAYVAWGEDFDSLEPSEGGDASNLPTSLEVRADNDGFWLLGERIVLTGNENAFVAGGNPGDVDDNGDTSLSDGFGVCTADQF